MLSGTCQICGRRISFLKNDRILRKHGHGRTSSGSFTSGGCEGSLELPYELSNDCCKTFQKELFAKLNEKNNKLESLKKGLMKELFSSKDRKDIEPGHPSWNRVFNGTVELLEFEITSIRQEIQRMESLINNWTYEETG
jgi:hypothetical protein